MDSLTFLHKINIIIHIISGTIALLLGILILILKKGDSFHVKQGKIFILLLIVVICTGFAGVFVFNRNTFLLLITVLSGYFGFSGYRTIRNKSNRPKLIDISIALLSLFAVIYFLYYFKSIGMVWEPGITYSTVTAIIAIVAYDFLRYLIPTTKYKNIWLYEHIYKMIGAFTALLAAFSGTVFSNYQPYSQFLPSIFGTVLAIGFLIYHYKKNIPKRTPEISNKEN